MPGRDGLWEGDLHDEFSKELCSLSDWTDSPQSVLKLFGRDFDDADQDDNLWPPNIVENLTATASTQTPFNDAATGNLAL